VISCPVGDRKTAELAAEAVDQATLQPEVVLRRAVEVSVKVVELDARSERWRVKVTSAPPPMADAKALLEPEPKPDRPAEKRSPPTSAWTNGNIRPRFIGIYTLGPNR